MFGRVFWRLRPTPSMAVAITALLVALSGTSYAAFSVPRNSVGTKQLKNNAVTTSKIRNGAVTAAEINTSGLTVPQATDANTLQGEGPSSFAAARVETAHVVGAVGQPAYENDWTPPLAATDESLSFYEDPWGIVHLQGSANRTSNAAGVIFTLPDGYRPAKDLWFSAYGAFSSAAFVKVGSDGTVSAAIPQNFIGFSGMTFRAGL